MDSNSASGVTRGDREEAEPVQIPCTHCLKHILAEAGDVVCDLFDRLRLVRLSIVVFDSWPLVHSVFSGKV